MGEKFNLKGSKTAIRYLNDDGVNYFVFDDIFTYIKKYDGFKEDPDDLRVLIEDDYFKTYNPDEFICRNEAYIIGDNNDYKVSCISKYGIISIKYLKDECNCFDINKLLALIEYIEKNI